jgi:hypothetical protein
MMEGLVFRCIEEWSVWKEQTFVLLRHNFGTSVGDPDNLIRMDCKNHSCVVPGSCASRDALSYPSVICKAPFTSKA